MVLDKSKNTDILAVEASKYAGLHATCEYIMASNSILDSGYKWNQFVSGVAAGDGRLFILAMDDRFFFETDSSK